MSLRNNEGHFGTLPQELKDMIFKRLDYPSAIFLAATNRHYHHADGPVSLISTSQKTEFLKFAEEKYRQHTRYPPNYACFHCYKIKPRERFHLREILWSNSFTILKSEDRVCLACGFEKQVYSVNTKIYIVERDGLVKKTCSRCRELRSTMTCINCDICPAHFTRRPGTNIFPCPDCAVDCRCELSKPRVAFWDGHRFDIYMSKVPKYDQVGPDPKLRSRIRYVATRFLSNITIAVEQS